MTSSSYYFDSQVASKALEAIRAGEDRVTLSLDLNLTQLTCSIKNRHLELSNGKSVSEQMLENLIHYKNRIFFPQNEDWKPLEIRRQSYVKLVSTNSAPTLEINGVKMHRSKTIDPLEDAEQKAGMVVRPGSKVLDTCGGLGYSAAFALKAGALGVTSVEKSWEVLQIRAKNPWLASFDLEGLELIHGDVFEKICTIEDAVYHGVIHDPPRFSSATGDLYGKAFYRELFRVMEQGGKLFHYTGSPKKIKNGDRFVKNTIKRLEICGFVQLEFIEPLQGVYARKMSGTDGYPMI